MYGNPQYYDPNIQAQYQQRMAQLSQQYPQFTSQPSYGYNGNIPAPQAVQQPTQPQQEFLSGRAVTSIDEVRAIAADPMGSIGVYTDVGNKKIYTKQIDTNGLAILNTYALDETPPAPPREPKEYVEKSEVFALFEQVGALTSEVETLKGALKNATNSASAQNGKGSAKPGAVPATADAK